MYKYKGFIVLVAICVSGVESRTAEAQRVIYRSGVGIGYASMDRNGNPMITMSRGMCRRNPDLCEFFKAHELGHHQLGHFHRNISVQQAELEADRYAAATLLLKRSLPRNVFLLVAAVEVEGTVPASNVM